MESYIQYAAGYSKDNVTTHDIKKAIQDIKQMDDEHGAFWVSVIINDENILEVDKTLIIIGVFEPENDKQIRYKAKDWIEVEKLYLLLLNKRFDEIRQIMK